jgi:starch phosphorylase
VKSSPPAKRRSAPGTDHRTVSDPASIAQSIVDHLRLRLGRVPEVATRAEWYTALAYTVRDRLFRRWSATLETFLRSDVRVVAYLSAEFLLGPHLGNNLINLGIDDPTRQACRDLGLDLDELLAQEEEPGLGNGGLGRLAACYLESLSTLEIPAVGYGIRYEFGIFDQEIRDGKQVEITDKWLRRGNPWEIVRPDLTVDVHLGGRTEAATDQRGRYRVRWIPERTVRGVPYDTPILGYRVSTVNLLRLWTAEACESFDFQAFNEGDYWDAVEEKVRSENLTKVLYPNDESAAGKRLRLEQQYFFVSCSLQDLLRLHRLSGNPLEAFDASNAIQLNDTHPAIAVAELMRLFLDVHDLDWDRAWEITHESLAYTNHTLLPEALETWPLALFGSVLPRHLEIIYEINRRFLDRVRTRYPGDDARVARMSLIDESSGRCVRMAHLAVVGSHAVNGVAALHTELLKSTVLRDFDELEPEKILNVTNGITPRRWMLLSNPPLAELIRSRIGERWITHTADELRALEPAADDPAFLDAWREVQRQNKRDLAALIRERSGIVVDPESLFDVQVKRIHEYKRQHLNLLHVITLYHRLRDDPSLEIAPRTVIFGGKAAPGYFLAKKIIELIHGVAAVVNSDPATKGRLRVAFVPDFNVTVGQRVYPAADLSEQISTAGKEASGTGNMKFALNGALTIGTLDGANVEIREAVGEENFFLFGLSFDRVRELRERGYDPRSYYTSDPELRAAIDAIARGDFSKGDRETFLPIVEALLGKDEFLLLADYRSYIDSQERVSAAYADARAWDRMSVLNSARCGRFSSDRSIREYCERIWNVEAVPVELEEEPAAAP